MTVERHNAHELLVQNLVITPPSENAKYARLQEICVLHGVDFDEAVVQNVRSYNTASPSVILFYKHV